MAVVVVALVVVVVIVAVVAVAVEGANESSQSVATSMTGLDSDVDVGSAIFNSWYQITRSKRESWLEQTRSLAAYESQSKSER